MARGQRFEQNVQVGTQNLSTGAAQGMSSVLQKLERFGQATDRLIQTTQAIEGAKEAQGETDIKKKREASLGEKLLTGGVKTAAYNKTLETAYLAGVANDTREAIASIEAENPNDIITFNEKVNGYLSGINKEVDPSVRDQVLQFADNQVTNARIRVHGNTIRKNKEIAVAESSKAIDTFGRDAATLAREGNVVGSAEAIQNAFTVIDALQESGDLMPDRAQIMKRGIEREASEQSLRLQFDGLIEQEGVEAAFNKIEELESAPAKGWTPDEWDTFITSAKVDIRQEAVRMQKANAGNKIVHAKEVSDLKIMASTGLDLQGKPVPPSKIIGESERLFQEGKLTGNERANIISGVINDQKVDAEKALTKQKVAQRLSGEAVLDLTQKDVDLTWNEDLGPEINQAPPEVKNATIAEFVNSTKIIPSAVNTEIKNGLISDDPEVVANSASLIDRLDSVRGIADEKLTPNERAFANAVTGLMQNMEPVEAIKLARENTNPNDKSRIEARVAIIKDKKWRQEYADEIESEFSGMFTALDPVASGQMTKEYQTLFEEHFKAGMDYGSARDKAFQLLGRNWKTTNATAKSRTMKYAPEDYYSVNGSVEYIQQDLSKSVRQNSLGLPEFEAEDLVLISDQQTAREATTGKPSYMVMIDRADQGLFPLVKFRYVPNMEEQLQSVKSENEKRMEQERGQAVTADEQRQAINRLFEKRF